MAEKTGRHDYSKDSQDANAVELARDTYRKQTGRDLEKDWASGDPTLRRGINQALGTQWESLAAGPRVGKLGRADPDRGFGFSDYAMNEHNGRPDTSVLWMSPEDYLGLSPKFEGKPFESPSGRSLLNSFNRGDHIESIPTLDVNVDGDAAKVTDQDGRHRAELARREGVQEIPVAVRGLGEDQPKQITGMDGNKRPLNLPPRKPVDQAPEQKKEPISLLRQIGDTLMPRAEAAEPPTDVPDWAKDTPQGGDTPDWAKDAPPAAAQTAPPATQKPVAEMTQQEAQAGNLTPDQQREWVEAQNAGPMALDKAAGGAAAAVGRGLAPYAAGAAAGAGAGALAGGVGALPGAAAGALAVGLDQLLTGATGLKTPKDATNALLDAAGVQRSTTPTTRMIEQTAEGAANALGGAAGTDVLAQGLRNPGLAQLRQTMRSPSSKAAVNWLMNKADGLKDMVSGVASEMAKSPLMQAASGGIGAGVSQAAAEAGLPPWMQTMVGMAASILPGGKGMLPNWKAIRNPSPQAKTAIEQGFAIPPADASVGHIGEFDATNALAATGGKVKDQQLASAQNQIVVDRKVAQDLGLPPETELTPQVFDQVRAREGQVYKEVENAIPEVNLRADPAFREEIAGIGNPSASTERNFPSTKAPPGIAALKAEAEAKSTAPTGDVMRYIADLRSRAVANFQAHGEGAAQAHRMGFAERQTADALEGAMERSIQNAPQYFRGKLADARRARDDAFRERAEQGLPLQGPVVDAAEAEVQNWSDRLANANAKNQSNQTLLDRFKQARQTMAKSYDVESVTNVSNGHVSATGLGRLKQRGKPLSGQVEQIADAANNFRKAFQNPSAFGGVEPLSILDAGFAVSQGAKAVGNLATGNIPGGLSHLAAAIAPLLRPFTRARILSPEYQKAMIAGPRTRNPAPLGGLTGALLPTQDPGGGNALMGLQTTQ